MQAENVGKQANVMMMNRQRGILKTDEKAPLQSSTTVVLFVDLVYL